VPLAFEACGAASVICLWVTHALRLLTEFRVERAAPANAAMDLLRITGGVFWRLCLSPAFSMTDTTSNTTCAATPSAGAFC